MSGTQKQRYSVHRIVAAWVIWDNQINIRINSFATRKEARAKCVALNRNLQDDSDHGMVGTAALLRPSPDRGER